MERQEILKRLRKIDRELIGLVEERLGLSLRLENVSRVLGDLESVGFNFNLPKSLNYNFANSQFLSRLSDLLKDEKEKLVNSGRPTVSFQGEAGAFSEVAARKLVPNGAFMPCSEFPEVFSGVEFGQFDHCVVPVENVLEGAVSAVNDLLTTTSLHAIGEIKIPIRHCLLASEETDVSEVRLVYSHPQALGQCRGFLNRHKFEPRPYYDTAGAAKMLAREKPEASAVIASSLSAEIYGLKIIAEGIEDRQTNATRFLLLSRTDESAKREKCSIIFAVSHTAGSLFKVLSLFSENNINLTRIASMPLRSDPDNYNFFLDFEGSDEDPHIIDILEKARKSTISMKFLGCYPIGNNHSD